LLPPLPNVKDDGAEDVPPPANGLLIVVASDAPAEKVKEELPPVPKIEPDPPGWVVTG